MKTRSHDGIEDVIGGVGFDDGGIIDLVMDGALRLASWDGQGVSIVEKVSIGGRTYVAGELGRIATAIYFPERVCLDEDPEKLRADVQAELARLNLLEQNYATLVTDFIFSSWVSDVLVVAPSLILAGGGPDELDHCLRLLACFCRRPLLIAQCDLRTFYKLPLRFQPTLLICSLQGDEVGSALNRISQGPGNYYHGCELLNIPIMKAVPAAIAESWEGAANIQIVIQPIRGIKYPAHQYYENLRKVFQPRLLGYRLQNLQQIKDKLATQDRTPGPMGPAIDAFCSIDSTLANAMRGLLKAQEEEALLERESQPQSVVAEAVLALCHDDGRGQAMVSEISDVANSISDKRGRPLHLVARAAGHQLKRIGIKVVRLGAAGRGIKFDRYTRITIHKVASHMQLPSSKARQKGCLECGEDLDD